ncbi:hypothetical protein [Amycolatopsis sp. NPDC102389]|uniref:hypothetical protein n=1 Tax=Amycolatopsis sp. NPDC102389 TaxID=3363941 RepID=UPI0038208DD7
MPDAVWVLNAMHEQGPSSTSYHEHRQAQVAEGSVGPHFVGGLDRETWTRLIGVLAEFGPVGPDTPS